MTGLRLMYCDCNLNFGGYRGADIKVYVLSFLRSQGKALYFFIFFIFYELQI